jgi:anti-anti-sigma regulatory factor
VKVLKRRGRPSRPVKFEAVIEDARAVRRYFKQLDRGVAGGVVIDLRRSTSITSKAFGAIMAGIRRIAARGRDVLMVVHVEMQTLFELSGATRYARVEIADTSRAA